MKKKLLLFALVALTTTLNGCSCSAEVYHSYVGSAGSRVDSRSSNTSLTREMRYFFDYIVYATSSYFRLPEWSTYRYTDYKGYIQSLIVTTMEYAKPYSVDASDVLENSVLLNYVFKGDDYDGAVYFYNAGLVYIKMTRNNGDVESHFYRVNDSEYKTIVSALKTQYERMEESINAELLNVVSDTYPESLFKEIDNMTSGTCTVAYDRDYWELPLSDSVIVYQASEKPEEFISYCNDLRTLDYSNYYYGIYELNDFPKAHWRLSVSTTSHSLIFYEEENPYVSSFNTQTKAMLYRPLESNYLYDQHYACLYCDVDQLQFDSFKTKFRDTYK